MTENQKTTEPVAPPVWPDVSDPKMRKCPRHKAWITSNRIGNGEDRYYERYCPRCHLEQEQVKSQQQKESGVEKPKLRIMTL